MNETHFFFPPSHEATSNKQHSHLDAMPTMHLWLFLLLTQSITPVICDESDGETTIPIIWFILPSILVLLLYTSCVMAMWPYARPLFPFWFIWFFILIPPLFPFFAFYLLIFLCLFAAPEEPQPVQVVVVETVPNSSLSSRRYSAPQRSYDPRRTAAPRRSSAPQRR